MSDIRVMAVETITVSGTEWGVSYGGPNPEPHEYLACPTRDAAFALSDRINAKPPCPYCGSGDVIPPASAYRLFTCDPCGRDFL